MARREFITIIDGIEGSGKTTLMTAHNISFVRRGGKLYTFPGYDVFDSNHRKVSQQIALEELVEMFVQERLENARLSIDEMENWLDSYESQSQVGKILVAIAQQRRKKNLSMIGTINPDWNWLPRRFKGIAQVLIHCDDMHFITKGGVPEGEMFKVTTYDLKGMITGKIGKRLRPKLFYGKRYRPFFDTYSTVSIMEKYTKVHINKRVIEVDFNGESDGEFNLNDDAIEQYAGNYQKVNLGAVVNHIFNKLKEGNVSMIPKKDLRNLVYAQGVNAHSTTIGAKVPPDWISKEVRIKGVKVPHYVYMPGGVQGLAMEGVQPYI